MALRIGVMMGGNSTERNTSIKTGNAVAEALTSKGYDVVKFDVDKDIIEKIKSEKIDLAYIAMQGKYCGDGTIQALMDFLEIPYTGCCALASAIINDKTATKKLLMYGGIKNPEFMTISRKKYYECREETIESILNFGLPCVIKAPSQGSSIGVSFINNPEEILEGLIEAFEYDESALVERMLTGTEVTVAVLGNDNPIAFPTVEIVCARGRYDAETKRNPSLRTHIVPARITEKEHERVEETAIAVFRLIECTGLARVDMMIDSYGIPYVIEINAVPGMAENSLFPKAAKAYGMSLPDLVDTIVKLAIERWEYARGSKIDSRELIMNGEKIW